MEIKQIKTDKLIPYESNPRNNDDAVESVANSIKEFGFKVPIVITKNNVVVTGHTRLKAAKKLKLDTVPCLIADDLSEKQIKAFRIADNKVGEQAHWNYDLLGAEMQEIIPDFDMTQFGFGDFEISLFYDDLEPTPHDESIEEEYGDYGNEFLKNKRIVIIYNDENEEALSKMLGIKAINGITYKMEGILNGEY